VPFQGLDHRQSAVLIGELDESVALAKVGLRALDSLRYLTEEAAAVLTLLSIGSEKMLKTTLGLAALDAGDPWPPKGQMRDWGHDIASMDEIIRACYERQLARSTVPGLIRQLLDRTAADPVAGSLLEMLTEWGLRGRFHRLDELSGAPQSQAAPHELWEQLESDVLFAEPELLASLKDMDKFDAVRDRVNSVIAESFKRWWDLHTRAWMTGVIGIDAKGLATILNRAPKPTRPS
jgi:hypothetical protein